MRLHDSMPAPAGQDFSEKKFQAGQSHLRSSQPIRIGQRTVEFATQVGPGLELHMTAIWDPLPPSRWKRTHFEMYRRARDSFLRQINERLGFEPILLDGFDLEGVGAVRDAAEVLLAARAAGVTVDRDGDPRRPGPGKRVGTGAAPAFGGDCLTVGR